LKDHPDISPETKEAVQELARKLNYTPDPIALSLKSRQSKIIGVIVPDIVHYFFSTVIHGIEDVAYNSDYHVMVCESNETYEREVKNVETLLSSRVDGILVSVSKETKDSDHFRRIQQAGVPIVFFDRVRKDIDTDQVVVDDEVGAYMAVDHLITTGRRRIALLGSEEHLLIGAERKAGYLRALEQHGIPAEPSLMTKCDTPEQAEKTVPELLATADPPDAFFAVNDLTAAVTLRIVKQHGYSVPGEIAIVGFTNGQISALTDPTLSSVEQFGYEMGKKAVQLLIDRLTAKSDYPSLKHVIETKLVVKGSSGR
jgi:LacI family transcriptional regulator